MTRAQTRTTSPDSDRDVDPTAPGTPPPVMPQPAPSGPSKPVLGQRTLLDVARERGLVRRKRRGNNNHNPHGNGGFRDHPENRAKGGHKKIPQSQRELKALLTELAAESIRGADGEEVERLVDMLRNMMQSKSPVDHMEVLNRLVGRQASRVDMTSAGHQIGWGAFIAMTSAPPLPRSAQSEIVDGDELPELPDADDAPLAQGEASAGQGEASVEQGEVARRETVAELDDASLLDGNAQLRDGNAQLRVDDALFLALPVQAPTGSSRPTQARTGSVQSVQAPTGTVRDDRASSGSARDGQAPTGTSK